MKKEKKPKLDISRFVKKELIEEWKSLKEGDLYYSDSYNMFYLVRLIEGETVRVYESKDGVHWVEDETTHLLRDLKRYDKVYLEEGETPSDAISSLRSELLEKLMQEDTGDEDEVEEAEENTEEFSLEVSGGKEMYEREAYSLMRLESRIEILTGMAKKKMERIRHEIYAIQERLQKVMRVVGMLELYLGVHEEIFQIQSGTPASAETPISIRQAILFMDEEVGVVNVFRNTKHAYKFDGNVNFQNIHLFDEWLLNEKNLNVILPETKGIVALRPSRNRKQYEDEDMWTQAQKQAADKMVYLLIRNGGNLYRVWTSIAMNETLFPTNADAEAIAKLFEDDTHYGMEKREKAQSQWLTNTLLIQGLFDRTELFHPVPVGRADLSKPETFESRVRLIRDAERLLSDGRPSFKEWKESLAESIQRGTRVVVSFISHQSFGGDRKPHDRFEVYSYTGNYPPFPKPGIYTIEKVVEGKWSKNFRILYLPDDEIYERSRSRAREVGWTHNRKKRYSFNLYSDEVFNYDDFSVEDVEYYLKSRLDRKDYYRMMPELINLREARMKELAQEKAFANLVASKHDLHIEQIMEAINWWKMKVINKRPLSNDDAKAWRMIVRHVKNLNRTVNEVAKQNMQRRRNAKA